MTQNGHHVAQSYTGFNLNTDRPSLKDGSMVSGVVNTTKLDKLSEKFLKEKEGSSAFRDTFFDKEIFLGIKSGQNYQ